MMKRICNGIRIDNNNNLIEISGIVFGMNDIHSIEISSEYVSCGYRKVLKTMDSNGNSIKPIYRTTPHGEYKLTIYVNGIATPSFMTKRVYDKNGWNIISKFNWVDDYAKYLSQFITEEEKPYCLNFFNNKQEAIEYLLKSSDDYIYNGSNLEYHKGFKPEVVFKYFGKPNNKRSYTNLCDVVIDVLEYKIYETTIVLEIANESIIKAYIK